MEVILATEVRKRGNVFKTYISEVFKVILRED